ncbi:DUF305 domain-containing protein [Paeniglutamicibacter terrestris]|uniref:DUF305 domain-containing protein n=1 Tax=Paeniglutamicibacter terrestris TaxID=2723403 RepID=A0ABX1G7X3_9MICC|nr:DUF305 domain-containing protein [Paeniglutamicibacter terrestris]NKG21796.1 DUF305 domain-containing protein [Paeniglutamicibacter terrestris]
MILVKKFLVFSTTALAAVIVLAGCSTGADENMPGMDHSTSATSSSPAATTVVEHNSADTMFAQMMIPHHEQAVEMSDIMLAKSGMDPKIETLAQDIKAAQGPEIQKMTDWLTGWSEPATMTGNHGMDGMMSDADLDKLTAAQGTEASKLFLTQMIAHHEGAVKMAQTEVTDGKNADAVALAQTIVSSQESEIKDMQDLLADL